MIPYANESDVLQIAGLTIENRTDRISVHGSIDLTKDKAGQKRAADLKEFLETVLARLSSEALPDQIAVATAKTVKNPFT